MTREELQKSEEPRFRSRRGRLPEERTSTEFVPAIVGSFSLKHGIWWMALYRDAAGARDFLDAAVYHLERAAAGCAQSAQTDNELFDCFNDYIGLFFGKALLAGEADWPRFDTSLELLSRAWQLAPAETDVKEQTPLALWVAALVALAALHKRPIPPVLADASRNARVTSHFRKLLAALVAVIDDPARCAEVRKPYRGAISIEDYRAALVRGLRLEQLLAISAVAECGDVMKGALEIFE